MVENIRLYKPNSYPIQEFKKDELVEGIVGYTSLGDCFKAYKEGDSLIFKEVHRSELADGEYLEDIGENFLMLKTFWALSKNLHFKEQESTIWK